MVAVERVFSQHNLRTVMGTAQVAGLALIAATRAGCPVALHTPSEVKAAVTGSGDAGKAQVASMVTRLLRLDAAPATGRCRRRARAGRSARCGEAAAQARLADAAPLEPPARAGYHRRTAGVAR